MIEHSINICFSTTDGLLSKIIRWFTRSKVSHCYITYMDQTLGRVMMMEADWFGFRLVPWDLETIKGQKLISRYSVDVPQEKQLEALHKLTFYLGMGYNYVGIVAQMARRIRDGFQNPFSQTSRIICSESVIYFLNSCEVEDSTLPRYWSPGELYQFVCKRPDIFIKQE